MEQKTGLPERKSSYRSRGREGNVGVTPKSSKYRASSPSAGGMSQVSKFRKTS